MVGVVLLRSYSLTLALLHGLALSLGSFDLAEARGLYDNPGTAEGWAWSRIKSGDRADLNTRCRTPKLDPRNENDPRWQDQCRKLSARFLQDLLTQAPWRQATPLGGIGIEGARIVGDLDVTDTNLIRAILIDGSRVEGKVNLTGARTDSLVELHDSLMIGEFLADSLRSETDLNLHEGAVFRNKVSLGSARISGRLNLTGASFNSVVSLGGAKVNGQIMMPGASFYETVDATAMEVGGNLLISSLPQNKTSFKSGLSLVGARIAGSIAMEGVSLDGPLNAGLLQVGGSLSIASNASNKTRLKYVNLNGARIAGQVIMTGTSFDGDLDANLLQVGGALFMESLAQNSTSFKNVNLSGSTINQRIRMGGARFDGALDASYIEVGGNLSMQSDADNRTTFNEVNLTGAKIKGELDMSGAEFDGTLKAENLHVDGNLLMQSDLWRGLNFKKMVDITGATVARNLSLIGASFDGPLYAGLLKVGGNLEAGSLTAETLADFTRLAGSPSGFKASNVKFKQLLLMGSKVEGNILIPGAAFEGAIDASSMQVGGDMDMRDSSFIDQVEMGLAHVGGKLDLRGAALAGLDLSGASIGADLRLGGAQEFAVGNKSDFKSGALNLSNAHIGGLIDVGNAWPSQGQLHVAGLAFGHLGGPQIREQKAKWWGDWARRDPDYSPSTYAQLAAAFTNEGDSDGADDIRYFRFEREREMACKEGRLGSCILQTTLGSVAGYGVGTHTLKVIPWVLAFWVGGGLLLWWTVPAAKNRGVIWCSCASLAQLLPVITINRELTEFFNDPERRNLKGWQVFVFSALGVVGLALGAILLIAVSGLTHKS